MRSAGLWVAACLAAPSLAWAQSITITGTVQDDPNGSAPFSVTATQSSVAGNCGMQLGGTVIFCEPFDVVNSGIPSRTGALDPNVWGVSRATGNTNFGQGYYNGWSASTQLQTCNGVITASPPSDIQICNGQLREATNDNPTGVIDAGGVTTLAMYPKQPFDFAGRTGTVSFDVSNDTHSIHSAWPEFWMSNLPVPAPFNHFDSWQSLPQHGFGVRFAAQAAPGSAGLCPNLNNLNQPRWTVDSAVVVRNYVMEDRNPGVGTTFGTVSNPPLTVNILDCVIAPPDGSGIMNHIELRITQSEIDVYATDAGVVPSPATLRQIASITNANLTFTRGLIWLEDGHYNADKGGLPSQRQHTFVWDNVAFDGPFTYRDFSYDALDVGQVNAAAGTMDLGKPSLGNQTASWNVLNLPANPQASAVRVLFNFTNVFSPIPTMLNVIVNGHVHTTPWPYPDMIQNTWRTFAVTIPITDLVAGANVVQLGTDQPTITSNVNIVLVDVPGGVPVLPGSNNTYPLASASCNLSAPAFCETFNQGPSALRGRGGDLDPARWSTSRLSGEFLSYGQGAINPVSIAPIPQCRTGITQTSVYPPNDTLICDASGTRSRQLMTAVSMQNYGVNSYMVRQPFDFAGRTGKIEFDVDASVDQQLGGFVEIELTDTPVPSTTFREFENYEVGPVPQNGLSLKFLAPGGCGATPVNTMVYTNHVGTIITPTFDHANGCAITSPGALNHFEVQVSQTHVDVYGSDFSPDNGVTFPNYKLLYSATISLPFSRAYVHFNAKNHASVKYGFGPDAVFHWDNIGFDGPMVAAPRAYEIPDNTTMATYNSSPVQNLGYLLLDGTTGKPAGIYDPVNKISALMFQSVNTSGMSSATLTLNALFQALTHTADTTWGIGYRFNGGAWRNRNLTAGDLASINAIAGAPLGILSMLINVPVTDLIQGTNTLELLPLNAPMDYPPIVANIDLWISP